MGLVPAIDYTNKDFQSLRQAMLDLARSRLPEWTDQSPSDLGMLLVDLFAYMGDVILYYQDRIANESFLPTALERRSVLNALRLIGYELAPPIPSTAELTLLFKQPPAGSSSIAKIPNGVSFNSTAAAGATALTFEYLGPDFDIDLASDQVTPSTDGKRRFYAGLPVTQSKLQPTVIIGSSTGEPNQSFKIPGSPVILDTLIVEINEGAGWVTWDRRGSLLYDLASDGRINPSNALARDYYVQFDENDVCSVIFGDGTYGRLPPTGNSNVRATYRIGGGAASNVAANAITDCTDAKARIALLDSVTNPFAAVGGVDHEDTDHAKQFGPLVFRSGQRAVTLQDYVALARQAGGVAKVRARAQNWNVVQLYVAPEGNALRDDVPETLRRHLISYFEDKRMAGTFVEILAAVPVSIEVDVQVIYDKRYQPEAVRQSVEAALQEMFAFKNVDFAQTFYLSDVYVKIEAVPGVAATTVTKFRRSDSPSIQVTEQTIATLAASLPQALASDNTLGSATHAANLAQLPPNVAALIRRALQVDVDADGRILTGDFEIAKLGPHKIDVVPSPQ